jgi:hypothetical protein
MPVLVGRHDHDHRGLWRPLPSNRRRTGGACGLMLGGSALLGTVIATLESWLVETVAADLRPKTGKPLATVPRHPDPLMLAALAADTAHHIRRVGAVVQVVSAGSCKGALQLLGPFLVGLGEPPDLIGGQAEVAEHRWERLTAEDRVQQLLPYLNR